MASPSRISLLLTLVAACGFPRPADVGDGASGDASDPSFTIHVTSTGDDANDGLTQPVKTLKRAIAIAGTNTKITSIALDAGRYVENMGEAFPYIVPDNVSISGSSTSGSILVGTKAEKALIVDTGNLQNLEFEDFLTAITATGTVDLKNVHVRTSKLAVSGETTSRITIDNLEIIGAVDVCGAGIELNGTADLMVTRLITKNLVTTLDAKDSSTSNIAKADITGDPRCRGWAFLINTSKSFTLNDSIVIGTYSGIGVPGLPSSPTQVMLTNTTLRDMTQRALDGIWVALTMNGGEILNNGGGGLFAGAGHWSLTSVKISANAIGGLYVSGSSAQALAMLTMRGCTVAGNRDGGGVQLFDFSVGDLGTDANPGNNVVRDNLPVGLFVSGLYGPEQVDAVGNTWNAMVQSSDMAGRYTAPATIVGPIDPAANNNFAIGSGLSVRR